MVCSIRVGDTGDSTSWASRTAAIRECLHYATSCFEAMKAYRGYNGKLRLFRPRHNCARMLASAIRFCGCLGLMARSQKLVQRTSL
ncbi:uncharacterized protein BDW43DRAFT_124894 [Aspergillus alliaceus]|uniref:uncharacterized protein n=1 Tax=Petromyces alliaceus TaxID=209559 RepID=UPI0012A45952|nr:uncharacterized protein BDW43DRAFT_124894 [Aspergillus alliaceus]KAB8232086.1 hypothetical protein BDW43DRAFT_124894 [Aspergillus alliaceus]